jgi:lysophospholipase L1-like esterase
MVASLQPAVVLLQVGSNDLCQLDKSVQEIEQKLIGLVLTLKYCYNVQRVAVLQILHRQWPRRRMRYPVDIPWFNDRVDTLNTFLRNYFKEDRVEGVEFWRHSGFRSPVNQELVYTDDGVHLNKVYGYPKYYNGALAEVVSLLN